MVKHTSEWAMKHPYKLGAGAKRRKKLDPKTCFSTVMREGYRGTLMSGSGKNVSDPQQMKAIAFSECVESRRKKKK